MKAFQIVLLALVLLGFDTPAVASEMQQSSRSAGKLIQDQDTDLSQLLRQSKPVVRARPAEAENYAASINEQKLEGIANRYDQSFDIYDADLQLIADLDGDGYHHAINVFFDVDVSYDNATVYAKLYLSREGEPWSQYFTTGLFSIHAVEYADAYEVETELLEGYPPGYYAVLIEIYSLDHAYMVASEVLDYHYLGHEVMIEDLSWDEPYYEYDEYYYEETHYSSHAASISSLLVFFLIIQVVIAARGALALSPCNKSDNKKKIRLP